MFLRDLYLIAKNSAYLPRVMSSSSPTDINFRGKYSEINYIDDCRVTLQKLIKEALIGCGWNKPLGADIFTVGSYKNNDEAWFFVNGVATSKNMVIRNAQCLADLFKRSINVVYNPTHGVIPDLAECAFARTFDQDCAVSKDLDEVVWAALLKGRRVKVIGHSQGGIIVSRLLERFSSTKRDYLKNLEIYTFASGADEDVPIDGVYQEHFANTDDFVARIGMINVQPKSGALYLRKEVGHLLNRDYLEHFAGGYFCGGRSKLYQMLGGNRG